MRADGTITYQAGVETLVGSDPALRFSLDGPPGETSTRFDSEPLAQFLTQRALEMEQARVEAMQASLLEKQRLRREVRYYAVLQSEHDDAMDRLREQEEEARRKAQEEFEARSKAEQEARLQAEAEAQRAAEAQGAAEAKARREQEDRASNRESSIERAPLQAPESTAEPAAQPKPDDEPAISMDGFMKMLQGVE